MFSSMQAPRIDLFEWLLQHASQATYNLAFSNIHGITFNEYTTLTNFSFPDDFELGSNAQYGADELKRTLCSMYHCAMENLVTTTGASEANFLVFSSLLDKGDTFIVEQPGYQPMWSTPEMLGARRISLPREFDNHFQIDCEAVKNCITQKTKLIVLSNLHNPSGVLLDRNTILSIAQIASEYGAYVLVDEIFLDGSFTSQPSAFGLPNVIVTGSTTKIYGLGGLHTGWVIAPHEITEHCQRMKAHSTGASSYLSEIMTARILRAARHDLVKRFQERAKPNFITLQRWMNDHTEFFEWIKPDGGIVCFPKYMMKISSVDLCRFLLETQKILLNPGAFFNQEGFVRISYGCPPSLFQEALDALEKGLSLLQTHG